MSMNDCFQHLPDLQAKILNFWVCSDSWPLAKSYITISFRTGIELKLAVHQFILEHSNTAVDDIRPPKKTALKD